MVHGFLYKKADRGHFLKKVMTNCENKLVGINYNEELNLMCAFDAVEKVFKVFNGYGSEATNQYSSDYPNYNKETYGNIVDILGRFNWKESNRNWTRLVFVYYATTDLNKVIKILFYYYTTNNNHYIEYTDYGLTISNWDELFNYNDHLEFQAIFESETLKSSPRFILLDKHTETIFISNKLSNSIEAHYKFVDKNEDESLHICRTEYSSIHDTYDTSYPFLFIECNRNRKTEIFLYYINVKEGEIIERESFDFHLNAYDPLSLIVNIDAEKEFLTIYARRIADNTLEKVVFNIKEKHILIEESVRENKYDRSLDMLYSPGHYNRNPDDKILVSVRSEEPSLDEPNPVVTAGIESHFDDNEYVVQDKKGNTVNIGQINENDSAVHIMQDKDITRIAIDNENSTDTILDKLIGHEEIKQELSKFDFNTTVEEATTTALQDSRFVSQLKYDKEKNKLVNTVVGSIKQGTGPNDIDIIDIEHDPKNIPIELEDGHITNTREDEDINTVRDLNGYDINVNELNHLIFPFCQFLVNDFSNLELQNGTVDQIYSLYDDTVQFFKRNSDGLTNKFLTELIDMIYYDHKNKETGVKDTNQIVRMVGTNFTSEEISIICTDIENTEFMSKYQSYRLKKNSELI